MLNEISQSQKVQHFMVPLTGGTQNNHNHRNRKQNGGYQGLWGRARGLLKVTDKLDLAASYFQASTECSLQPYVALEASHPGESVHSPPPPLLNPVYLSHESPIPSGGPGEPQPIPQPWNSLSQLEPGCSHLAEPLCRFRAPQRDQCIPQSAVCQSPGILILQSPLPGF